LTCCALARISSEEATGATPATFNATARSPHEEEGQEGRKGSEEGQVTLRGFRSERALLRRRPSVFPGSLRFIPPGNTSAFGLIASCTTSCRPWFDGNLDGRASFRIRRSPTRNSNGNRLFRIEFAQRANSGFSTFRVVFVFAVAEWCPFAFQAVGFRNSPWPVTT